MSKRLQPQKSKIETTEVEATAPASSAKGDVEETGGPTGPEPTRYGDWERNGRCVDF